MEGRIRPVLGRFAPLIVLLAAFFAAEPILHTHPLSGGSEAANPGAPGSSCAICAAGLDQMAATAPSVTAPTAVSYALTPTVALVAVHADALILPSRAPPAAN